MSKTVPTKGDKLQNTVTHNDSLDVYDIRNFFGDCHKSRIDIKKTVSGRKEISNIEIPEAKDILGFFFPPWIDLEKRERVSKHQIRNDYKYEMSWDWNETEVAISERIKQPICRPDGDSQLSRSWDRYVKKNKECISFSPLACQMFERTAEESSFAGRQLRAGLKKCELLEEDLANIKEERKQAKAEEAHKEHLKKEKETELGQARKEEEEKDKAMQKEQERVAEADRVKTLLKTFEVQYSCLKDDFYFYLLDIDIITKEGTFGKTYEAYYDDDPVEVTMYSEDYPSVDPGRLISLRSQFVSKALVFLQDENDFNCLIYPDMYVGSLWDLMEADPDREYLEESHALFVLSGLMEGIRHISSRRITHAHLTPDVVKLNRKGYPVICDFNRAYNYKSGSIVKPRSEKFNVDYLAPEVARGLQITPESDIFAAACIAYEIIEGQPPFTSEDDIQTTKNLFNKKFQVEFDDSLFSQTAKEVIGVCLRTDPEERSEWEEIFCLVLEPSMSQNQEETSLLFPLMRKLLKS